jgi:2,5-diamino-6-(ribosylamino)-4(3H)-pyrimidinone 5'-phosphate reductase
MLPRVSILAMVAQNAGFTSPLLDVGAYYELGYKLGADAVLAGADSMLSGLSDFGDAPADETIPTVKAADGELPWLVITDSAGRMYRNLGHYRHMEYIRDCIILASDSSPKGYLDYLKENRYRSIISAKSPAGRVDLRYSLERLAADYGISHLRADAVGRLSSALLNEGLVDELVMIYAPLIEKMPDMTAFPGIERDIRLSLSKLERLEGGYFCAYYSVVKLG